MPTIVRGRRWGGQTLPIPDKEKPPLCQGHGRCLSHVQGRWGQRQRPVSAAVSSGLKESSQCRCVCSPEPAALNLQPCNLQPCSPATPQPRSAARAGWALCPCRAPRSCPTLPRGAAGCASCSQLGGCFPTEVNGAPPALNSSDTLGFLGQGSGSLCQWGGQCGGCSSCSSHFQACSISGSLEPNSLPVCPPGHPCLFLLPRSLLTSPHSPCPVPLALLPLPHSHSAPLAPFPLPHSHFVPLALLPLPCSPCPIPTLFPLPHSHSALLALFPLPCLSSCLWRVCSSQGRQARG